jgi:AAA15 family ATPase/GTPase
MIIRFTIRNFGSIKDEQILSFEATKDKNLSEYYTFEPITGVRLLKLILIYGANASGKTTILKSLDFLRHLILQPAKDNNEKLNFQPFLLDKDSKTQPSELNLSFIQEKIKYRYQIVFNQNCILSESLHFSPKEREAKFFSRTTDIHKQTTHIEFGNLLKLHIETKYKLEANTTWNRSVIAALSDKNIDFPALKTVYNWFKETLMPLVSAETDLFAWTSRKVEASEAIQTKVTELLRLADFQIDKIEVVEEKMDAQEEPFLQLLLPDVATQDKKFKITKKKMLFNHLVKNFSAQLTRNQESQGTLRYYGIGGVLATVLAEDKIVGIDELDNSLHPDLTKNFLLRFLAQAKSSQMFVTTHNLHLMTQKDILRFDAIWFTEKNEQGFTELYSAADFDTSILRKSASLLNMYEVGKLGAKPNLGSIFNNFTNEKKSKFKV